MYLFLPQVRDHDYICSALLTTWQQRGDQEMLVEWICDLMEKQGMKGKVGKLDIHVLYSLWQFLSNQECSYINFFKIILREKKIPCYKSI